VIIGGGAVSTAPLFMGIDTHALGGAGVSRSALEVFAANDVTVMIDERGGYTPTPVISHCNFDLQQQPDNRPCGWRGDQFPSHNPP